MNEAVLQNTTSRLFATQAYSHTGHETAVVEQEAGATPVIVCVTCTKRWGQLVGRRRWQEQYPCCFSEAYPNGLADLGITAQVHPKYHEQEQGRCS